MGESAYTAYTIRDSPFHPRAKVQGREGGERGARTHKEVNVEGKTKIHCCQQPKDSYANEAEMRCKALIYTRVARHSLRTDPPFPQEKSIFTEGRDGGSVHRLCKGLVRTDRDHPRSLHP